jgi:hypothetical protein
MSKIYLSSTVQNAELIQRALSVAGQIPKQIQDFTCYWRGMERTQNRCTASNLQSSDRKSTTCTITMRECARQKLVSKKTHEQGIKPKVNEKSCSIRKTKQKVKTEKT